MKIIKQIKQLARKNRLKAQWFHGVLTISFTDIDAILYQRKKEGKDFTFVRNVKVIKQVGTYMVLKGFPDDLFGDITFGE